MQPGNLEPTILVIFGITGDLAKRKVMPAIYHLFKDGLLTKDVEIIGTSRRELTIDDLLKDVELCVLEADNVCDPDTMHLFRERLTLLQLNPVDGEDYERLGNTVKDLETKHGVCMHRLYYLSIPPQVYGPIIRALGEHGLNTGCEHDDHVESRLLVEKPFGYDLTSAEDLIVTTNAVFTEPQVYRIDHYLAKETAQNILTFRSKNPLFGGAWNNRHITAIDIWADEQIGIESRANFYDSIGAMRDLIQSHLLQLLALTTMRLPEDITDSASIHEEKRQLLAATTALDPESHEPEVVRAQYRSYRDEVGKNDSFTETFANVKLWIRQPEWEGVPITLRTGKSLARKETEIAVTFGAEKGQTTNVLTFHIQPNEGIGVSLLVKKPGFEQDIEPADMNFTYQGTFDDHGHPDAYERVLIDAVRGDQLLFATREEVLASWHILQPILDHWQQGGDDLRFYDSGSEPAAILDIT